MDGLEAVDRINELNDRISSLSYAYDELWRDFDSRIHAIKIRDILTEIEIERDRLSDKLRAINI